jgi:Bacterial PH domain
VGTVRAKGEKRADAAGGRQTFRSPTGVIIWWVWLLFAAANVADLAVQGHDHASLVAAAILLLATGVAYVMAQRPSIVAGDAGITIRNPLLDYHVGWARVTRIDLTDLLRVHCAPSQPDEREKVISAWAVRYSRRRQLAAEARAQRAAARAGSRRSSSGPPYGGNRGYGSANIPGASPAEAEAEKIAHLLSERATAARAEAVWAEGTAPIASAGQAAEAVEAGQAGPANQAGAGYQAGADLRGAGWLDPLTSTWSRPALAALLVPALILLVVSLL